MLNQIGIKRRLGVHSAFLAKMVRSPRSVGAIAPSSRFVARAMAAEVDPHHPGWVIELGAGTGVVTKALLAAGVKPERLLVVELDRRMCSLLRAHFPDARVAHGDAAQLDKLLAEHHIQRVSAVVSSLPLLIFPKPLYTQVVAQMLDGLPEDAPLVQFTYGPHSPIRRRLLKRHGAKIAGKRRVWLNVPPVVVWRYERGHDYPV